MGHGSFACALIEVFRLWLRREGIGGIELFSSNSRFIEAFRIAAILEAIPVTEFLHGISVDLCGKYYDIIDGFAHDHGAELTYVNMLPGLPQPAAVERKLLRENGVQVFFRNERSWAPRGDKLIDLLIVGSGILDGDYIESDFFRADLAAIDECRAPGLSVMHCPHPLECERTMPRLPKNTAVGTVAEHINSARVVVGHFSTVIFTTRILGHNVLVFPGAWARLPDSQAALFPAPIQSSVSWR
jgi:hypothetical protein